MDHAYREDLAYTHDVGFGKFARNAAPILVEDLRRRGIDHGLVIDLGCGSGILSEVLAANGYDVLGIDISPAFIDLARKRVPAGQFLLGSLLSAELPNCVAVACIGECVNYLFDDRHSWNALEGVFGRVFAALPPGGPLLFDASGPGRVPPPGTRRAWFEGDDWAVLVAEEEERETRLLTRHITSFRRVTELYRRDHEVHVLRLLPHEEVVLRLRQVGFAVELLDRYGPLVFPPGFVGFLARKPAAE
jgi:SAM-dependent methyltransferase